MGKSSSNEHSDPEVSGTSSLNEHSDPEVSEHCDSPPATAGREPDCARNSNKSNEQAAPGPAKAPALDRLPDLVTADVDDGDLSMS